MTIRGQVHYFRNHGNIRNRRRRLLIFDVTDFTDTIIVKMFAQNEQVQEMLKGIIKEGRIFQDQAV